MSGLIRAGEEKALDGSHNSLALPLGGSQKMHQAVLRNVWLEDRRQWA